MSTNSRILENAVGISKGPSAIGLAIYSTDRFISQNCLGYNLSPTGGTSAIGILIAPLKDLVGNNYEDNNNITLSNSTGLSIVGNGIFSSGANLNGCVGYASSNTSTSTTYGFIVSGRSKLNNCSSSTGIRTNVVPLKIQRILPDNSVLNSIQIENSSFISDSPNKPVEIGLSSSQNFDLFFRRSSFIQRGATSLGGSPILTNEGNSILTRILEISNCIIEGWDGIDASGVTFGRFHGNDITLGSVSNYAIKTGDAKTFAITSNVIHGGTTVNGGFQNITNQVTSTRDSYDNIAFYENTATINVYYRTQTSNDGDDLGPAADYLLTRVNNGPTVSFPSFIAADQGLSYSLNRTFTANTGDVIYYGGPVGISYGTGLGGPFINGTVQTFTVGNATSYNLYVNFATYKAGNIISFGVFQ